MNMKINKNIIIGVFAVGIIEIKTPKVLRRFGLSSVTGSNKFDVELLNDI